MMSPIRNRTRKTIVAKTYALCFSHWKKARGLMFTLKMRRALLFFFDRERRWGLHMFFVFYPIDVIFLDGKKKVVEVKEDFRPFAFYAPKNPCRYIVELPKGAVKKSRTSVGDRMEFSE